MDQLLELVLKGHHAGEWSLLSLSVYSGVPSRVLLFQARCNSPDQEPLQSGTWTWQFRASRQGREAFSPESSSDLMALSSTPYTMSFSPRAYEVSMLTLLALLPVSSPLSASSRTGTCPEGIIPHTLTSYCGYRVLLPQCIGHRHRYTTLVRLSQFTVYTD